MILPSNFMDQWRLLDFLEPCCSYKGLRCNVNILFLLAKHKSLEVDEKQCKFSYYITQYGKGS